MDKDQENSEIDLKKILLPKKEGPSPASAQRVNAGALLEQEQKATLRPQAAPQKSSDLLSTPQPGAAGQTFAPQPGASAAAKEESVVKPLTTYRGDIEQAVQRKNISVVSIAAAEAERRNIRGKAAAAMPQAEPSHELGLRIAAITGGIVLLAGALGLIFFVFFRPQATAPVQNNPASPFISVDATQVVAVPVPQWGTQALMQALEAARESTKISLGLISRLYVVEASSTVQYSIDAQTLLSTLVPNIPPELVRSLSGEYLLGVHSFDDNQALFILGVQDYGQAYSAMLSWEFTMQDDLAPLFLRTPRPRIPEEGIAPVAQSPVVTSTGSTSSPQAATSTASMTADTTPPQFLQPRFVDRVVENRDARVIQNEQGDILLLWTFLDRNTLLITTNEYTLREVISRLTRPPTIPLP